MRHMIVGLLALLVAVPVPARVKLAKPPEIEYTNYHRLPKGKRLRTRHGTYQAYTLEEMKVLLEMDVDLWACDQEATGMLRVVEANTLLLTNCKGQIREKDNIIQVLKEERLRLTNKWAKENRLRHVAENKTPWSTWIAWSIAGVALLAAGITTVVLAVREK